MQSWRVTVSGNRSTPEVGVVWVPCYKKWYGGFIEFDGEGNVVPARYAFYPEGYFDSWEKACAKYMELK
jgi:hypothetical protein